MEKIMFKEINTFGASTKGIKQLCLFSKIYNVFIAEIVPKIWTNNSQIKVI